MTAGHCCATVLWVPVLAINLSVVLGVALSLLIIWLVVAVVVGGVIDFVRDMRDYPGQALALAVAALTVVGLVFAYRAGWVTF